MKLTPEALLILPRLRIENANTVSSPLTWGFPSITAVLGFTHALERKIQEHGQQLTCGGVAAVCHSFEAQVTKSGYEHIFCLTRNPLTKEGDAPAMVEEGRAHMTVSLLIQLSGESCQGTDSQREDVSSQIVDLVQTLRFAGGSIFVQQSAKYPAKLLRWPLDEKQQKKIRRNLLPGFALISREDLLKDKEDMLEAWVDQSSVHYDPPDDDNEEWSIRPKAGWIVPIPIGYQAISEVLSPGTVKNARDYKTFFRFVENIYSLGQWISPHRINDINHLFWHYEPNPEQGVYRCINHNHFFNLTQEIDV